MLKIVALGLAGIVGLGLAGIGFSACAPAPRDQPRRARETDIRLERDFALLRDEVRPNATLPAILSSHRIAADQGAALLDAVARVFDLRSLKAHHPYEIELAFDGLCRQFRYQIDPDTFLRVRGSRPPDHAQAPPQFTAEVVPYRKEHALVAIHGHIDSEHNSLVAAINGTGENVTLAIALAELFAGDIDFDHDLQPGDEFEVVFEVVVREGARAGYGDITAATFTNQGKTFSAYRYQVPGGKPAFYDADGRSLKRFFLASPLKFEPRVTSGFSFRRLHPVLGYTRPHYGVDFGAPTGAPVVAIAEGVVEQARFTAGGGNTVQIRHASGYESEYLHLSAFGAGIRAGAHVSQGQLIGRVGATGLATGPHLHFGLKKNGEHVNPLAEQRKHPPGEPIPATLRAAFDTSRDADRARFVSASAALVAAAATPPPVAAPLAGAPAAGVAPVPAPTATAPGGQQQ
jgi:murein DD-endopeptidase MepM/ murein hydrolase activator NlpD